MPHTVKSSAKVSILHGTNVHCILPVLLFKNHTEDHLPKPWGKCPSWKLYFLTINFFRQSILLRASSPNSSGSCPNVALSVTWNELLLARQLVYWVFSTGFSIAWRHPKCQIKLIWQLGSSMTMAATQTGTNHGTEHCTCVNVHLVLYILFLNTSMGMCLAEEARLVSLEHRVPYQLVTLKWKAVQRFCSQVWGSVLLFTNAQI